MGSWGHNVDATTLSLIGMAAMLSAVIHAPLAALLAVFELSGNVQTLTLAMTVIVLSDLIMRSLFRMPSIFERLLMAQGLSRDTHLYRRVMMSSNVRDLMDDSFHDHRGRGGIDSSIESNWHLVDHEDQHRVFSQAEMTEELTDSAVDSAIFCSVDVRSSLLQALDTMQREGCERLIVTKKGIVQGVLSQKHIEDYYRNAED
jgi:CIC family chloride channel protein